MNCYNGEKYLREALDSVYQQTFQDWEIVFWDNASTDSSASIAQSYDARVRYARSPVNEPLGAARAAALRCVRGRCIGFLDTDDVYLPHTIETQLEALQGGGYGMVYGGAIVIDQFGKRRAVRTPRHRSGDIFGRLLQRYDITMASALVDASAVRELQLSFRPDFWYGPDYHFFMTIASTYPVGVIPRPIVKYRQSPGSLSHSTRHLVSKEAGATLEELEHRMPERMRAFVRERQSARDRLVFYDAVGHLTRGDRTAARTALRSIAAAQWQYRFLLAMLSLRAPTPVLLRLLGRN